MSYRIRYHRDAKAELEKCRETYDARVFPARVGRWLSDLAEEAESKSWTLFIDLADLLGGRTLSSPLADRLAAVLDCEVRR
jgi:hypothetical protein